MRYMKDNQEIITSLENVFSKNYFNIEPFSELNFVVCSFKLESRDLLDLNIIFYSILREFFLHYVRKYLFKNDIDRISNTRFEIFFVIEYEDCVCEISFSHTISKKLEYGEFSKDIFTFLRDFLKRCVLVVEDQINLFSNEYYNNSRESSNSFEFENVVKSITFYCSYYY